MQLLIHVEHFVNALFSIWEETSDKLAFQTQAKEIYLSLKEFPQIIQILSSYNISKKQKKKILDDIFKNKISEIFLNFFYVLIENNFFAEVLPIFINLFEKIHIENNIIFVKIISPYQLSKSQLWKIKHIFAFKFKKKIVYNHFIDKNLIGGIKIIFDDNVYDYSIKGKIEDVKWKIENKEDD